MRLFQSRWPYLDEEAHRLVLDGARREGTLLSRWARKRLVKAANPDACRMPEGFFQRWKTIVFREPAELDSRLDGGRGFILICGLDTNVIARALCGIGAEVDSPAV